MYISSHITLNNRPKRKLIQTDFHQYFCLPARIHHAGGPAAAAGLSGEHPRVASPAGKAEGGNPGEAMETGPGRGANGRR